jgi:hypothetical protein
MSQALLKKAETIMDKMVSLGFAVEGGMAIQDAQRAWRYVIEGIESGQIKPKKKQKK